MSVTHQLHNHANTDKRANKWPTSLKLDLLPTFCMSRKSYKRLRDSGSFELPSPSTMSNVKNAVKQVPGINPKMMAWMHESAMKKGTDRQGGLLFDEMKIQEALVMKDTKEGLKLVGLVELGDQCGIMRRNTETKPKKKDSGKEGLFAEHILQIHFITFDGFRFPVAFYPASTVDGNELYVLINECLQEMYRYDFKVCFLSCDGATANRNLFHTLQGEESKPSVFNPFDPSTPLVLYSDYSHVMKRIRNWLEKSDETKN